VKNAEPPQFAAWKKRWALNFKTRPAGAGARPQLLYQRKLRLYPAPQRKAGVPRDAVLDVVVAEKLYRDYPALDEGKMTKLRASLVQRDTLAAIARRINLGGYLLMGKGEESTAAGTKRPISPAPWRRSSPLFFSTAVSQRPPRLF